MEMPQMNVAPINQSDLKSNLTNHLEATAISKICTHQPAQKLVSRWEMLDGKLACKWFNSPD